LHERRKKITKLPSLRNLLDEEEEDKMDVDTGEEEVIPIAVQQEMEAEYERVQKLPPILRNRPIGIDSITSEEDKFRYDVSSRPDSASTDEYESTPLEKFGEAMLRGMGWKPGAPVGLNSTEIVPIRTFVKRPDRLGLGAAPDEPEAKKRPKGWVPKQGESRDPPPIMVLPKGPDGRVRHVREIDEKLVPLKRPFYDGAPILIKKGEHKGLEGTLVKKSADGSALIVLKNEEKLVVSLAHLHQIDGDIDYVSEGEEPEKELEQPKEVRDTSPSKSQDRDRDRERNHQDGNGKHSDNGRKNDGDKQRSDDRKRKRDDKSEDRKRKRSKYDSDEEDKKKKKDKYKSKEPI